MQKGQVCIHPSAGMLIGAVLLAFSSTTAFAQQKLSSNEHRQSLISVAPAAHPQGEMLARHPGDATFKNAPANYHVFSAATAGEDAGVEPIRLNFAGETRLTRIESKSKDFVVEPGGTCHEGHSYAKGDSCSLMVRFNPQGAGHRLGHLEIAHSAEAEPLDVGLVGNGYSPVISFTPSEITTVSGTYPSSKGLLSGAQGLTVDGGDILYIADTGNADLRQIDSSGTVSSVGVSPSAPASLAVDSFGFIYYLSAPGNAYYFDWYAPWGETVFGSAAYKPGTCTESTPCALSAVGMDEPGSISIDPNENLFMAEGTKGAMEMPVAGWAGGSVSTMDVFYLRDDFEYTDGGPAAIAVDPQDNLYTNYYFPSTICYIVEEPQYSAEQGDPNYTRVAGGDDCGFSGDGGQGRGAEISTSIGQITFDIAGNLYFTDSGNQRVRRIDAVTGIIRTIAGNGTTGYTGDGGAATSATLSSPTGVAVDSQGQVYVISSDAATGTSQVIRKVGTTGYLGLGSQAVGLSGAAQTVLVSNTGNSQMTLTNMAINGANPGDFAVDPSTTTCDLAAGANLTEGLSCQIGVIFTPKATGARTANLVLLDNAVTGTNTVVLNGTGILATPTLAITSPKLGQTYASGSTLTFTVTVTGVTGLPAPTGTVKFGVNGVVQGSPVAISGGSASITLSGLATGSNSLTASYSGDSNYAGAGPIGGSINISGPAVVRTEVALERTSGKSQSCASAAFAVDVTSKSAVLPTGEVRLFNAKTLLAWGTLADGKVTLKAALKAGTDATLVAHYLGDRHHLPSESAVLKLTTTKTVPCEVK
jgi:hypothetical protein